MRLRSVRPEPFAGTGIGSGAGPATGHPTAVGRPQGKRRLRWPLPGPAGLDLPHCRRHQCAALFTQVGVALSLARRLHLGAVGAGLRRGYSFRGEYGGNGNPVRAGSVEHAWRGYLLRQRGLQAACSYVYRMGLPTSRPRWDHLAVVIPPVGAARAFPPWVSDSKARVQDVDGAVVKNGALLENFRDAQVAVAPAVATDLECHMAGVPDGVIGIFGSGWDRLVCSSLYDSRWPVSLPRRGTIIRQVAARLPLGDNMAQRSDHQDREIEALR